MLLWRSLRDPHGAEIPEDFVHLVPGQIVKVALLRSGHEGRIADVGDGIGKTSLRPGMHVVAQDRQDAGQTWVLKLPDGQLVRLNHSAADDISVELDAK